MQTRDFRVGDRVMIVAKDDFFAYVDGKRGTVAGFNCGLIEVRCPGTPAGPGGTGPTPLLTFFVPGDQLAHTV